MNDMALTPNTGPAGGSRSQVMAGNAIKVACELLLDAMRKPDGSFRTYDEMVAEEIPPLLRQVDGHRLHPVRRKRPGQSLPHLPVRPLHAGSGSGCETGKVTVEKFTCVADCGVINNKLVVDGQILGGLVQGIGLALSEDFEDLDKHKDMISCGFPYIKNAPDNFELIYVETPRPLGPFGASGVGELPRHRPTPP